VHRGDAPELSLVVDQGALERPSDSPETMHEQYRKIIELLALPNVSFRVVPLTRGAHPGIYGPFQIVAFNNSVIPDLVYKESYEEQFVDRRADVARYRAMFEYLTSDVRIPNLYSAQSRGLGSLIRSEYMSRWPPGQAPRRVFR
jgi:Domain of unknown function (DUF5753)